MGLDGLSVEMLGSVTNDLIPPGMMTLKRQPWGSGIVVRLEFCTLAARPVTSDANSDVNEHGS